ncbi:Eco57I restriction-modification methylase domain-containing protein [Bartonella sp. B1099]|uniref:Eco57I restriction-modification methylase domain-containing protein n=1 Tax=Bartonella sp. B1099 TaxID=2911422 RepID=UPI0020C27DF0|nr:hypothetical protein [Bartonella sp. B1099]
MNINLNTLESVFNNKDFISELEKITQKVKEDASTAPNEKTIETRFDNYLYALFERFFSELDFEYKPIKEKNIVTFKSGRVDTALANVLIEFKQPSKLSSDKDKKNAIKQLLNYLKGENENHILKSFGLLTDGEICYIITIDNNGILRQENFTSITSNHYARLIKAIVGLNQKTFDSTALIDDFSPTTNSPIRNLSLLLYKTINDSATEKTQMLLKEWKNLFKLSHNDHSQQKDIIKRKKALGDYLSLSLENVESEYNALFSLQTAYSILIKLIAFKVVSQVKFDDSLVNYAEMLNADSHSLQAKMMELESGSIIRDYGVQNLLEGDFFSWYSTKFQWNNEIAVSIKLIIQKLNKYTTFDFFNSQVKAKDFFKNLYQTVMPSPVRHALGEYYTPYWLANHIAHKTITMQNLKQSNKWRSLDPTCGSGTFITALINQLIRSLPKDMDKGDILREITSRVVGIDLNPLAVLTARVNYFLNISQFMTFDSEIEIPIYSGDAAYTPELVVLDNVEFIKYSLNTNIPTSNQDDMTFPVYFPEVGLRNLKKFSRCMIDIELDIQLLNAKAVFNRLKVLIPEEYKEIHIINKKLQELADNFVRFEKNNWNGIWARIITNYLTTSKIGMFDIVVGNPPWVDWKNLPSHYREKIKSLGITKTIFSGDARTGGINLNVAALITNVVASNWLDPKGVMGLLMPDTFLVQKTYEGYRNLLLTNNEKAYFLGFDDWTKAGNPFEGVMQKFYTYYFTKQIQDYQKGLKIYKYTKNRNINTKTELLNIEETFKITNGKVIQPNNGSTNFLTFYDEDNHAINTEKVKLIALKPSDYRGREGVEVYPLELMLYEYIKNGVRTENEVTLRNAQFKKSKFKVSPMHVFVEKKYLHPLIRGVDITPFHINSKFIVPFAYDKNVSKRVAIDELSLRENSPKLFKHFIAYKEIFEAQNPYSKKIINGKNVPFYSLARVGDYTFAPYHVAFRDNTKNVASIAKPLMMPWGELKPPVFQNHAVTISQRPDGSYISLDEAYYIAGIINADIVSNFVKISSDGRSFPINPRYQIPLYGLNGIKDYQDKIATLSKIAHEKHNDKQAITRIKSDISIIYLDMLDKLA